MSIGDIIMARPMCGATPGPMAKGRVVYIHPLGRFYTLEFTYRRFDREARFRESYFFQAPEASEEAPRYNGARGSVGNQLHPKGRYITTF